MKEDLPVVIRDMAPEEYPAVMRLWAEARLPFKPQGRDAPLRVQAELRAGRAIFLVAEVEGRLVGSVIGTHDGRKGWINRLAVAPSHRRRGIARRLVEAAEARLAEEGIEVMAALIESDNTASLAFFTHIGYLHDPQIEYVSRRKSPEV
jgi:ribosomal protein S18 acetylase RimI-like enzyme